MNQHEAQLNYKEFRDKLNSPYCVGVAQHLERLALKKELEQFRQSCSANGITLLEPCPFCGSYDVESVISGDHKNLTWVECDNCETEGPPFVSEDRAIAAWNQRVN